MSGWNKWRKLCQAAQQDTATFDELCQLLMTHEERHQLGQRIEIIENLLAKKISQRNISEKLNVSIAKITRGSNELKRAKPKTIKFISQTLDIKS